MAPAAREIADSRDAIAADADVGDEPGRAAAVDDAAAGDDEIVERRGRGHLAAGAGANGGQHQDRRGGNDVDRIAPPSPYLSARFDGCAASQASQWLSNQAIGPDAA